MKPALLVIDLQKAFYDWTTTWQSRVDMTMDYMNWAIYMFRSKGLPVIQVLNVAPELGIVPGAPGFEMHPKLKIETSDPTIHKYHGNSFKQTDLDKILKELGVDTVILTGVAADQCVLATYFGALDLDYRPFMLSNAIDGVDPAKTNFVLSITDHVTPGVLKTMLDML